MRVGNSSSKLLNTVGIKGDTGDNVHEIFTSPHYVPVAYPEIKDIEIKITDDAGNVIDFKRGRVVVKLHFRKKRLF